MLMLFRIGNNAAANGLVDGESGDENGRCSPLLAVPLTKYLLPLPSYQDGHKKCMVIDLDETLVHSSFKVLR